MPLTTIVSVLATVAVLQGGALGFGPAMIRPALAPVPTTIKAESPPVLMVTVAVPAPKTQVTAPCAGEAAPRAIRRSERVKTVRKRAMVPLVRGFDSSGGIL